ncbi:hypothetical protein DPEC_G00348730 [Dallia pectoralis]|uniref:Uncharacterized protein n=1 Tax=Dallia pectoralis TaxID=75939 RepID=A0ACC2F1G8_DALPE|nr:hypothetical protein DPEC_G00348730 [Dallia pectoralis]
MEDPANMRDALSTCQDTSNDCLDYPSLTMSLPAVPEIENEEEERASLYGLATPTSKELSYWRESDEWSQWQGEFRGQIRALRHWLKSMEMRLPPVDCTRALP